MKSFILLTIINIYVAHGISERSFYTPQEEQTLELCSREYNTYINRTEFKLTGSLSDETNIDVKCLFFCVPKKLSITDETGIIDTLQIRELISSRYPGLSDTLVKAVVRKCSRRREIDVCDKWYYLTKCIWNTYLTSKARSIRRFRDKWTTEEPKTTDY